MQNIKKKRERIFAPLNYRVFAQDGGIEFGGLRWWSAQIGGLTWWDASLSTTLCKENQRGDLTVFTQIRSPLFQFPFIIKIALIIIKEKLI